MKKLFEQVNQFSTTKKIIFCLSLCGIVGSIAIMLPQVRSLFLPIGEKIIGRSFNYPQIWMTRMLQLSIFLLTFFGMLLFNVFFYSKPEKVFGFANKNKNSINAVFLILPILFLATLIFYNLINAGWIFGDDHQFLTTLVQGKSFGFAAWGSRFWPIGLSHHEINIFFGNAPIAYLAVVSFFLVILAFFTYKTVLYISKNHILASGLTIGLTCMPSVMLLYFNIIYPETALLALIALSAFLYVTALKTERTIYYVLASIVCSIATYYKEPVFGLFLVFALTQLIFNYKNLSGKQKKILFYFVLNAVMFVIAYKYFTQGATDNYAEGRDGGAGIVGVFISFVKSHILFDFAIVLGLYRLHKILTTKKRDLLVFDAYLLSGLAYVFAYIVLKMSASYYITPAYLLWFIAFAGYITNLLKTKNMQKKYLLTQILAFILASTIFIGMINVADTAKNTVAGRKDTIEKTNLIVALDNAGYEMYIFYPQNLQGFPLAIKNWQYWVLHVFSSIEKNNGKYDKTYIPIKKLSDTEQFSPKGTVLFFYSELEDVEKIKRIVLSKEYVTIENFDIFGLSLFLPKSEIETIETLFVTF